MTAIALTIAGSDSGGGAGVQADLKTFSALGVYGASVITALTAQNTLGVTGIHDVPPAFVTEQADAVFSDLAINALKIGMLSKPEIIDAVAAAIDQHKPKATVLDPVMVAESGDPLINDAAVAHLAETLFSRVTLITPNLHEAARLLQTEVAADNDAMEAQAEALLDLGANAVLLKGGHSDAVEACDVLGIRGEPLRWYCAPFIDTKNTHGTGCSLSSAIAAQLAKGDELPDAVHAAKLWLSAAIGAADDLDIGQGAGPVHHFHALWNT
ncbi:bifunctional hydroxymethylpyrimidine kinase/phosphomethylpyrimidine kinase [Ahrensia sp. R2A130]|uniref:bifunctional hydroxymethylpyrimidine kinase/phosphomethylpyrimidine kinase n=1 Tax=Ahrensia sp. R2A130 TaxID=744979 RepID=UPI0001E0F0D4|nr:bifunctional hydroxymethylpyrimidine kinase/phosphomethylpyrimidine kinase [Ahrensia sp. R2A130]EFL88990.1 phosphomethylpyrimidine kinase [Ahrensia sp. R2A130]